MAVHHPSPAERTTASLDVEVRTFTADGLARGGPQNQTVHLTLSAGAPTDVAQVELLSHLDLKPGRYQMRMGVHSSIGDTNGSVYVDVDVPDFANAPVSMSGIVLEARPSHTSVPTGALAAMIPVVPTTEREFSHSAHASVFLRLYQGGTPPPVDLPVRIQIIDQAGAVVVDRVDTIAGVGFGATSRSADEHIALPISELTSGEYLLTIETTLGRTTARRDVRFSVK
jgi:hypothetical protein